MRRSGQTTRQIDACVQELFNTGRTEIHDHHGTALASRFQFDSFIRRLSAEHNFILDHLNVDKHRMIVEIKNFNKLFY